MDGEPWQLRLKALGIRQSEMADAIGMTPTNLSAGLRGQWLAGVPQHIKALIIALESMSEDQRRAWLAAARAERQI